MDIPLLYLTSQILGCVLLKGIVLAYPTSHVYWCMVSVENTVCAVHKCFCIYMVLMPHK